MQEQLTSTVQSHDVILVEVFLSIVRPVATSIVFVVVLV